MSMPTPESAPQPTRQSMSVPRLTRVIAWLSLAAEILIIGTGGGVRLTGSGLGCPTWPTCDGTSVVNTPEMGIHGLIEFGNRTLTGLVGILALALLVLVWRLRQERLDLFVLAWIPVIGVVSQAVIGGITVLTGLNPFIVGFHFVASLILVAVCAAFLVRAYAEPGRRVLAVPGWYARLTHLMTAALAVTICFGVLTTGAGPHSGDEKAARNGFDAALWAHFHSWPSYLTASLVLILFGLSFRFARRLRLALAALTGLLSLQMVIGIAQANLGLPAILVATHMVIAALITAIATRVVLSLKIDA